MDDTTKISEMLRSLGISFHIEQHAAVFTVAESLAHLEDKQPVKNLLLQEKGAGRKILVIMDGAVRLDVKQIAGLLQTRKLSFAPAEVLQQVLGVSPGLVSLFSLGNDITKQVEVVVDGRLLTAPEVGFHPNDNTATVFIPGSDIPQIIQQSGHQFTVLSQS